MKTRSETAFEALRLDDYRLSDEDESLLDEGAMDDLRDELGEYAFDEIVEDGLFEVTERLATLELSLIADDIDLAGALALDMIEPARAVGLPKLAELCEALGRCCSGGDAIAARAVAERLLRVGEESLVAAAESVPARAGA